MLSAHIDTVPVCVGSRPVRKGGRVVSADKSTGLGADDRSGAAVLLTTVLAIVRGKLPHPPLTILWTVQEEVGLFGARHVKKSLLGKSEAGVQFRRRLAGEAHARRDRRLSHDDRRPRPGEPRRRRAGRRRERDRDRVAGDRRPGEERLAWADRRRAGTSARATSA